MRDKNAACFNHWGNLLRIDFLSLSLRTNDVAEPLMNKLLLYSASNADLVDDNEIRAVICRTLGRLN
jgi:hypothetical protein